MFQVTCDSKLLLDLSFSCVTSLKGLQFLLSEQLKDPSRRAKTGSQAGYTRRTLGLHPVSLPISSPLPLWATLWIDELHFMGLRLPPLSFISPLSLFAPFRFSWWRVVPGTRVTHIMKPKEKRNQGESSVIITKRGPLPEKPVGGKGPVLTVCHGGWLTSVGRGAAVPVVLLAMS